MRYIPHTEEDVARMLRVIGAPSVEALFAHIPQALRLARPLAIEPLDEVSLLRHLGQLGAESRPSVGATPRDGAALSFLGAGLIPHHVPSAVDMLLTRAEWYTSYTPYQPEISQGTLQAVFEFQTLCAELFGPPAPPVAQAPPASQAAPAGNDRPEPPPFVANASMYDGASAAAEAVLMARRITGRRVALLCGAVHPQYAATTRCYLAGLDGEGDGDGDGGGAGKDTASLRQVPFTEEGRVDLVALDRLLDEVGGDLACLVAQTPNYLGVVEDLRPLSARCQARGGLLIGVCAEPLAMGVLRPPGAQGADIVAGEGLGLATPPSMGGPGVGLFAARSEHMRQMPGRLVGETVDQAGRRGYVLTLAAREQHIRRDKATSNICTNQGLIALAFTIHLSLLGRRGFEELARLNLSRAHYARGRLSGLRGFRMAVSGPTFNELAVRVRGGRAGQVVERLADQGIFAGVPMDREGFVPAGLQAPEEVLLLSVTERHSAADIDRLAQALDEVCP